jgi:DNA-binding transcriptional regulator YhcF (GntR family)
VSFDFQLLTGIDPNDARQASQQIATTLRALILTGRISPGEKLPSQPELATHFKVARETVKRALDILRAERLIVTRQGAGAFVRTHTQKPVELRPHIEDAFSQQHVSLDFAGFSGETLRDALTEPLDKVRAGRLAPETISIRVLASDMSAPMAVPASADAEVDDEAVRDRARRITSRALDGIVDQIMELSDLGLTKLATAEVRQHRASSLFKLYVLNGSEVFFGFYPVIERNVPIGGEPTAIYDLLGKDVPLFHYIVTDDDASQGSQFVAASRQWFDSVWNTIAYRYPA